MLNWAEMGRERAKRSSSKLRVIMCRYNLEDKKTLNHEIKEIDMQRTQTSSSLHISSFPITLSYHFGLVKHLEPSNSKGPSS